MKVYYISTDNGGYPESGKEVRVSPLFSSEKEALEWAELNNKPIEEFKYRVASETIE